MDGFVYQGAQMAGLGGGSMSAGSYNLARGGWGYPPALRNEVDGAQSWYQRRQQGSDPMAPRYLEANAIDESRAVDDGHFARLHAASKTQKHHDSKELPEAVEFASKQPPGTAKTHAGAYVERQTGQGMRRHVEAFVPVAHMMAAASPRGAGEIAEAAAMVPSHVSAIAEAAKHMKRGGKKLVPLAEKLADDQETLHKKAEILRESTQHGSGFLDFLRGAARVVSNVAGTILPGPLGMAARVAGQLIPE